MENDTDNVIGRVGEGQSGLSGGGRQIWLGGGGGGGLGGRGGEGRSGGWWGG